MTPLSLLQQVTTPEAADGAARLAQAIERLAAALEGRADALLAAGAAAGETAAEAVPSGEPLALPTDLDGMAAWVDAFRQRAIEYAPEVLAALAILVVGWLASRFLSGLLRRAFGKSRLDPTLTNFLVSCAHLAMITFVAVSAVSQLGVNTASFVAVLGAAGFAVGFALQGSLSNFAAGVMLMIFRPLRAGDFVEAGGVAGTVQEVGVFHTILTTAQGRRAIVANSTITGGNIINTSVNGTLRVDMSFSIGYADDLERALGILRRLMDEDPRVLKSPAPLIACNAHEASSVKLICWPWVRNTEYGNVWNDTHKKVKEAFDAAGISIPFPQQDVHVHQASA